MAVRTSGIDRPPPAFEDGDGAGGGEEWTLLMVARSHAVGYLVAGRLKEEGIDSRLDTANPAPGAWLHPFGDPRAPVRVLVRRRHLEWGRLVLEEAEHRAPPRPAPRAGRVRVMAALVVLTLILLGLAEVLGSGACVAGILC